ncbi:LacI family DNA-binding transcriptional regulator [Paenibacillus sp. GCM10027626]|uniref:LacI family DNA-binding transcriptional regulator n=1 Tax=Paenibacillus sp. GCM10027626 TaxID=3273411 RepID=UPI00363F9170
MVTKKEIADYLGISRAAVSLVLNNTPSSTISSKTRNKILQAARELGYRDVDSSPKICFILYERDADDPRYMRELHLVEHAASQAGYGLMFMNVTKAPESIDKLRKALESKEIDGSYVSGDVDECLVQVLRSYDTPFLLFGLPLSGNIDDLNYAISDNRKWAFEAVNHLISLGHTRIALFSGSLDYEIHQLCLKGYCDALEANEIPLDRSLIQISDDENGYELCKRAEMLQLDYSAVFCVNNVIQFGVLQRLQSIGVSVPDDISLIGVGLIDLVKISVPQLTTYYMADAIIAESVSLLIDLIHDPGTGRRACSITEFSLFEGGTVAPKKS